MFTTPRYNIDTQVELEFYFTNQLDVLPPDEGVLNLLVVYDHPLEPDSKPEAAPAGVQNSSSNNPEQLTDNPEQPGGKGVQENEKNNAPDAAGQS